MPERTAIGGNRTHPQTGAYTHRGVRLMREGPAFRNGYPKSGRDRGPKSWCWTCELRPPASIRITVGFASGMSATMEIVVYERDDAVLVPVAAVDPRSRAVELVDRGTGSRRTVPVKTGRTTANAVEILEGVSPGDVVLVP